MRLVRLDRDVTKITDDGTNAVLFSYETPVAVSQGDTWYVTEYKWSKTTTTHINKFVPTFATKVPQGILEAHAKSAFSAMKV